MDASHLRLRRIRFKDGRTVEVLRSRNDTEAVRISTALDRAVTMAKGGEREAPMVGFALVAWAADGQVFCTYENGGNSTIPAGHVPQYAKDCLLATMAANWSKD